MKKFIFINAFILSWVFAQGVVTQLDKGSINYSEQLINAVGIGFVPSNAVNAGQARRMALRIAKQDAMRLVEEPNQNLSFESLLATLDDDEATVTSDDQVAFEKAQAMLK